MASEPTIRERISKIQRELRDGALTPDLTRESLVVLTALLGNVGDELRIADHEYKLILRAMLRSSRWNWKQRKRSLHSQKSRHHPNNPRKTRKPQRRASSAAAVPPP